MELIEHGACDEGIALYDAIAGEALEIHDWTPLHTLWLATAYPAFHGWLVSKCLIPIANLRDADLHNANLRRANLHGAYRDPSDPPIPGWRRTDNGTPALNIVTRVPLLLSDDEGG